VEAAVLRGARFAMVLPIVLLLAAAAGSFIYGAVFLVDSVRHVVANPFPIHSNIGYLVTLIDLILVGVTLIIGAFGLHQLFTSRLSQRSIRSLLPRWLVIADLRELEARFAAMIVLVAAVSFVDVSVGFVGGPDMLYAGISAGLVIAALTAFLLFVAERRTDGPQ
jgi:uncharacterized membrane protein YqhA